VGGPPVFCGDHGRIFAASENLVHAIREHGPDLGENLYGLAWIMRVIAHLEHGAVRRVRHVKVPKDVLWRLVETELSDDLSRDDVVLEQRRHRLRERLGRVSELGVEGRAREYDDLRRGAVDLRLGQRGGGGDCQRGANNQNDQPQLPLEELNLAASRRLRRYVWRGCHRNGVRRRIDTAGAPAGAPFFKWYS
jgi:hypothetical protein